MNLKRTSGTAPAHLDRSTGYAPASLDYRWVILGVTLLAQIAVGGSTQGVPPLAVFYQADLTLDRTQVGFFNSAIAVGLALSLIVSGWVADLIGIRKMMLVGLVSLGFALFGFSFARTFPEAIALLVIAGITTGVSSPAIPKAILVWFPIQDRGFAMGIQRTGIPLMGALAAAILPSIALVSGWRTAIQTLAVAVVIAGVVVYAVYREAPVGKAAARRPDVRPGNPWRLLLDRNMLLACALPAALVAVQFSLATYLVLFLIETLGTPVVVAGGALAIAQMGGAAGRVAWGMVSDRLFRGGRKSVLILIGVMSSVLLMVMGSLPAGIPLWAITPLVFVLGFLTLGWHALHTLLMPELAAPELASSAVGLGYTILQVGAFVGPPLFGFIVDSTGDYRWAWRAAALVAAAGTALLLLVKERKRID